MLRQPVARSQRNPLNPRLWRDDNQHGGLHPALPAQPARARAPRVPYGHASCASARPACRVGGALGAHIHIRRTCRDHMHGRPAPPYPLHPTPCPPPPAGPKPPPPRVCAETHVVKFGDTCGAVAQAAGITYAALRANNPAINAACTNLQVGWVLCVRGGWVSAIKGIQGQCLITPCCQHSFALALFCALRETLQQPATSACVPRALQPRCSWCSASRTALAPPPETSP